MFLLGRAGQQFIKKPPVWGPLSSVYSNTLRQFDKIGLPHPNFYFPSWEYKGRLHDLANPWFPGTFNGQCEWTISEHGPALIWPRITYDLNNFDVVEYSYLRKRHFIDAFTIYIYLYWTSDTYDAEITPFAIDSHIALNKTFESTKLRFAVDNTNPGWTWINTNVDLLYDEWFTLVFRSTGTYAEILYDKDVVYTNSSFSGTIADSGYSSYIGSFDGRFSPYNDMMIQDVITFREYLNDSQLNNLYDQPQRPLYPMSPPLVFDFGANVFDSLVSDGLSLNESQSRNVVFNPIISDQANLSDSNSCLAQLSTVLSDQINLSDSTISSLFRVIEALVSDTLSLSDVSLASVLLQAIVHNKVELNDTGLTLVQLLASISDKIDSSDSVLTLSQFVANTSDGAKFSDSLIGSLFQLLSATISDGVNLSDLSTAIASYQALLSDSSKFSDLNSVTASFVGLLTDGTNLSDGVISSLGLLLSGAVSDAINLSDLNAGISALRAQTQDSIIHSDDAEALAQFATTLLDSLTVSDETRYVGGAIAALLSDVFKASDQSQAGFVFERALSDGLTAHEYLEVQRFVHGLLTDQLSFSDVFQVGRLTVLLIKLISAGPTIKINEEKD